MVWFRVDDTLAFHRKALAAGNSALGVWVRAGAQSGHELTEGRVSTDLALAIGSRADIRRLVTAGLWHQPGHDCPDCPPIDNGYVYHDWLQANPSAEQVKAERAAAADRQRRAREAARNKPGGNGVSHAVTAPVTNAEVTPNVPRESDRESRTSHTVSHGPPDPTRPDLPGGGSGVKLQTAGAPDGTNPPTPSTPNPEDHPTGAGRPRCMAHRHLPDDEPGPACASCKQARQAAEQAEHGARIAAQRAISQCRLCDADGRRLDTLGQQAVAETCNHQHRARPAPTGDDGAAEFAAIREASLAVPCEHPQCGDPGQPTPAGEPCRGPDGEPLRAPAHHTRITAGRKVPA